jgi:DNA-binding helix-hairpin-helix protein with protein kinase domain
MEFRKGEQIALVDGGVAVVESTLGSGGQGIVYMVKVGRKPYALKWYTCKLNKRDEFIKNMARNIDEGPPDKSRFLWPLYMTEERQDGRKKSFGYIMELRPKEFSEFSEILLNRARFPSMGMVIEAALNIVMAFQKLHRRGFSYQDLNDGNFFINVNDGSVLICDNDNVTPDGKPNAGNIGGKPGYMAPEIVRGEAHPDSLTDRHSLAVILFKLFFRHDPLMGKAYVDSVCITEQREAELYGIHPVFIFDPNDSSNRPVNGIHPNPIKLWPLYPDFFQNAFITSFVEGMKDRNARLNERQWQAVLVKLRDILVNCPFCGGDLCLNRFKSDSAIRCECGRSVSYPLYLKTGSFSVPLFPGNKLYACHTIGLYDKDDVFTRITGEVIMNKNNPSIWGIKNLSPDTWYFTAQGAEAKPIENGSVIPIVNNLEIKFKETDGKIVKI